MLDESGAEHRPKRPPTTGLTVELLEHSSRYKIVCRGLGELFNVYEPLELEPIVVSDRVAYPG